MAADLPLELADLARLAEGDVDPGRVLQRVVEHARDLVPGCTGAALTARSAEGRQTAAWTGDRVARCHAAQFAEGGAGPAVDTLVHGEPRRSDDLRAERRWPGFAEVARSCGFRSCLALPLRSDRAVATALNLYADEPGVFRDTTFDVALFFAAAGGAALDNAELYRRSVELVGHLHATLAARGLIERAKGLLMGREGIGSEEAFDLLRRQSQHTHRKLRDVAADLVGEDVPWTPPRGGRPGGVPEPGPAA
ncbi:GAF and ANTAR domain-containing protein [Geodermatophilus sp. SYSU D00758]